MKTRRLLTRLITVCILAVVMFSVKDTLLVLAAEGDVAVVVDGEGTEVGAYATLPEAFVACRNGYTIRILSDINEPDLVIGYDQGEDNKHIILDLNKKSVTLQMLHVDYSLYIMNGTLTASISNGNVNFTNALLTVSNANIYTDMLSWMTDDGMSIKNGSNVTLNGSSCWFEKLFMDKDCVFSVKNGDGVGNYVHFADGSYYVRYSETKNYYASPAVKVVVEKGKVPASNEPTTGDVTTEVPTTEKPTAEEPTTGAATTEEQTTGEQTTEAVSTEKQTTEGTTDAASTAQTTTEGSKTTAAAPNTGDDSNVAWLMMLMAVCLLGAAGVVAYKKER